MREIPSTTSKSSARTTWRGSSPSPPARRAFTLRASISEAREGITLSHLLNEWAFHDLGHVRQIAEIVRAFFYPHMGPFQKYYKVNFDYPLSPLVGQPWPTVTYIGATALNNTTDAHVYTCSPLTRSCDAGRI